MLTQSEQSCVATFLPSPTLGVFFLNVYGLRCGLCLLPVALHARGWEPVHGNNTMAASRMQYTYCHLYSGQTQISGLLGGCGYLCRWRGSARA